MKNQWILVANASNARIFSRTSASAALIPVATMSHPDSRLHASELTHDRPGREAVDGQAGGNRYEPHSDPRRKEHQRFAREIAHRLDEGLAAGAFNSLLIFASNKFLGELKAQLSEAVTQHLSLALSNDLTSYGMAEIEERMHSTWLAHK